MDPDFLHETYFNATPPKVLAVFWTAAVALGKKTGEPPSVFCLFVKPRISHVDEDTLPAVPDGILDVRLKFFELLKPPTLLDRLDAAEQSDAPNDGSDALLRDILAGRVPPGSVPPATPQVQSEPPAPKSKQQRAAGYVDVQEIPGNKSRVIVTCERVMWPRIEPTWRLIEAELKAWLLPLEELVAADPDAAYRPWELIPDVMWDREAVRLWWQGLTNKEIARKIGVTEKTVANRFAELRRTHIKAIPKRRRT